MLDNNREDDEAPLFVKGQQVRTQEQFLDIFKEAGLLIFKDTKLESMPGNHRDVRVWALY